MSKCAASGQNFGNRHGMKYACEICGRSFDTPEEGLFIVPEHEKKFDLLDEMPVGTVIWRHTAFWGKELSATFNEECRGNPLRIQFCGSFLFEPFAAFCTAGLVAFPEKPLSDKWNSVVLKRYTKNKTSVVVEEGPKIGDGDKDFLAFCARTANRDCGLLNSPRKSVLMRQEKNVWGSSARLYTGVTFRGRLVGLETFTSLSNLMDGSKSWNHTFATKKTPTNSTTGCCIAAVCSSGAASTCQTPAHPGLHRPPKRMESRRTENRAGRR